MIKKLATIAYIVMTLCISGVFADSDIYIQSAWLANNQTQVVQFSTPRINVVIGNHWPDPVQESDVWVWSLVCTAGQIVFEAWYLGDIYIPVWWFWNPSNLKLDPAYTTQVLWTVSVTCSLNIVALWITDLDPTNNALWFDFGVTVAPGGRFDLALDRSIENIQQNLDPAESALGSEGVINFVRSNVLNLLIPIIIILWVVLAIVGFYKMMFSDSEEWIKEWSKYVIRGIVGIIIMMSSRYLANTVLFENILSSGNLQTFNGIQVAQTIYNDGVFPFIKIAMYLALGVLFIIVVARVLTYLTSPSEDVQKQAATLITWNVIGILIILWAKQIVELILGKQADVMEESAQGLGDIGSGVLTGNIPIVYTIINRVMGLAAFIVLIIIIFQTYQLLVNPTNEETMGKLKKSFGYIAIGIIVIGAWYVITNFLIIN